MKKNLLAAFLFFSVTALLSAASYQITGVHYDITGRTRRYALERKVKIDKQKIFSDEDELMAYIADCKQQLENTRAFETADIDFTVQDADANGVCPVTLSIRTKNSLHFILTPFPKYDSNRGLKILLKAKDTNFLGSMETMSGNFDFAAVQDSEDETKPVRYQFGFGINFDLPFRMGKVDSMWANNMKVSYTIGDHTPEWDVQTGVKCVLPFEKFPLAFEFTQAFTRDLSYEDKTINGSTIHYGDGTYFTEAAKISLPILIQKIIGWGNIYYTPFVKGAFHWDFDGISKKNTSLLGPEGVIGHTLSGSRVNWSGNFRNGISVSLMQSFTYNFHTYTFSPGITGEIAAYKAFPYVGLSTDAYAAAYLNSTVNVGPRLRGIRDDQYFSGEGGSDADKKACETPAAFVMNIDAPVRLFKIHWDEVPGIRRIPFAHYFDMEMQLSPFMDFAFIKNRATGTNFSYKDGFWAGGIEVLVYPLRWKGIQVRGSIGFDLSRKMPWIKGKLNQDWRSNVSAYEISIGIGLHY